MDNIMINIENLSYDIKGKKILENISFNACTNKFIGIIGANGSGKTTMLKHLYNAIVPYKKTVYIKGIPLENYSQNDIAKNLSVMKQENNSDFDYRVIDIVLMGRLPYKKSLEDYSREDHEKAMRNLNKLGMRDFAQRKYNSLSGGEKQRVLIARALTQDTEIMILDEPTNHLDIYYQMFLMQILKQISMTVISVFHDLNFASKFCDEIYVLKAGKILVNGRPEEVINPNVIKEAFNMDSKIINDGKERIVVYNNILE